MFDISKYSVKDQVWLIIKNKEFIQVFNKAKDFKEVETFINGFAICSNETIEELKYKFNQS